MPMGLINAPETFMQMMNNVFIDMLDKRVAIFLDYVLIYSIIAEEYSELLEKEFAFLCKHEFYCKLKKCSFL